MIDMLLRGVPTVKNVEGVAAATSVDLQPPAGEQWVIAWAEGKHDDNGGARVCGFQIHDSVTSVNVGPGVAIANDLCLPLYQTNPDGVAGKSGSDWNLPLVLNERAHLTLVGVAIGAGKKLYISALVYVFRGIGPWGEPV
jgi:hypothetical protein